MAGEKQFKEKLKLLNEDFMNFISSSFQENPFYDFTPTVTDYLNHVKNLDAMYAEKQPTERKIAVAKRRIATPAVKPKEILKPAIPEPKKLSNGLVEPIGQFAFAPKVQMPEIPSAPVKTPVFSAPKSSDAPTPSSQSRKRRQEPLDYDDMRNKSSNDYGKAEREPSSTSTPSIKSSLFGGSAKSGEITSTPTVNSSLFGTKSSETPNTPASNNSLFGTKSNETTSGNSLFGAKSAETTSTPLSSNFIFGGSSKSGEATNTPTINSSLFGTKYGETTNTPLSGNSLFGGSIKSGSTPNVVPITNSLFGGSVKQDEKTNTPPTNNFLFGSKPDEKTNTLSSNNSLFGTKPGETTSNNSLFGGSVKSNEASNAVPITSSLFGGLVKPGETTNTLSSNNSLFGGLVKPGQLSFNFKGPENSATSAPTNGGADNKDGEEGDAEDAPPPKAEIVKHEEPDAAFSTKCSLFNFVNGEYKKVGVGFMHIKKTESGTQLLIRAATALGTVWINTYINDSFKAEKKAKDKIQFSYPSAEGAKTSLVRVVDAETAVAYLTGEKKP